MASPRYRILYVGNNYPLLEALQDGLLDLDCLIVRCPKNGVPEARTFIKNIPYTMFVFDEALMGTSGEELARFTAEHQSAPILIAKESDDVAALTGRIRHLIARL